MRHNKKFNHLSRTHSHRDALLSNMTASLILHKRIFTTLAKAKALRVYAEPLLNRGKEYNMQNWRLVFSRLNNKEAVKELFKEVGPKIANRAGGYTRILKTGNRLGDNAKMCFKDSAAAAGKGKKTRRSRGKKAEAPAAEAPAVEAQAPAAEAPAAE